MLRKSKKNTELPICNAGENVLSAAGVREEHASVGGGIWNLHAKSPADTKAIKQNKWVIFYLYKQS